MSNGPLPTTLTFLTSLSQFEPGSKVRFLGSVTRYHIGTGTLWLQHAYSASPPPATADVTALVDVKILLEGLKGEDTIIGAWVNVMGYVEEVIMEGEGNGQTSRVKVQAIMLWSAGGLKIGEYEKAVEGRLRNQTKGC